MKTKFTVLTMAFSIFMLEAVAIPPTSFSADAAAALLISVQSFESEVLQRSVEIQNGATLYMTGRISKTYALQGRVSKVEITNERLLIYSDLGAICSMHLDKLTNYTPEAVVDLAGQRGIMECIGSGLPHSDTDQLQFTPVP